MREKISVIIPCYNDGEYINQAVNSAWSSGYDNMEIIVVDDGSNIETRKELEKLRDKISKLIIQPKQGVSVARNNGIKDSSGDYIVVLDSDDYFEPNFFKIAQKILEDDDDVKLVTCFARRFDANGTISIARPESSTLKTFLKYNAAIGVMFRKKEWKNSGGYEENMINGFEDWELYIRLLRNGGRSYVIPEVLFHYRFKKLSKTSLANTKKAELTKFIFDKHKDLYLKHIDDIIYFYIDRVDVLEKAEKKVTSKPEYKVGSYLLAPLKRIRKIFRK